MAKKIETPSEKIVESTKLDETKLSDKLLEELKSSPVEDQPNLSELEGASKTQVKPEPTDVEDNPKKGWHLPKFPFKQTASSDETAKVPESTQQLTTEALLKMIDEKTEKIGGDEFLTIRINKQWSLLLIGLLLILIWTFPLMKMNAEKIFNKPQVNEVEEMNVDVVASSSASIPETGPHIRVRLQTNTLDAAETIKKLLNDAGFSYIDFVYDTQVDANTVLVVTQPENNELKQQIIDIFADSYQMASEAAELTDDSNFEASVLVGKDAKVAK